MEIFNYIELVLLKHNQGGSNMNKLFYRFTSILFVSTLILHSPHMSGMQRRTVRKKRSKKKFQIMRKTKKRNNKKKSKLEGFAGIFLAIVSPKTLKTIISK